MDAYGKEGTLKSRALFLEEKTGQDRDEDGSAVQHPSAAAIADINE